MARDDPRARGPDSLQAAKLLAVIAPGALLAGAYGSQYLGGLAPCEMCYWQRWAHMAALFFAVASMVLAAMPDRGRAFVWLAALAILTSGGIGAYHAGVEAGIFEGITRCTAGIAAGSAESALRQIMAAPLVRCDQVQWELFGVSMAGWNAILSIAAALGILWLSLRRPRTRG